MQFLIIIPAVSQAQANDWCKKFLAAEGGELTFSVALNLSGRKTALPTHYWCSICLTEQQAEQVRKFMPLIGGIVQGYELDEWQIPGNKLAQMNIKRRGEIELKTLPE